MIQYIYTLGADLISQECNGKTYTYLYDGHGSVTALFDESGKITDTYSYDAFGNLLKSKGRTANNYRYCGEQFDSTTGLYYLRARYMDTNTGRFITQDSYAGSVYDPVSLHKYLYANSNPVMYTDPSGYSSFVELAGVMAIQGVLCGMCVGCAMGIIRSLHGDSSYSSIFESAFYGMIEFAFYGMMLGIIGAAFLTLLPYVAIAVAANLVFSMYYYHAALNAIRNQSWIEALFYTYFCVFGIVSAFTTLDLSGAFDSEAINSSKSVGSVSGDKDSLTSDEKKVVEDLVNQGNNVEIIPRSEEQGQKTPDFYVNGVKTELKTLHGTSLNTPVTRINNGFKQGASVVIIDARNTNITASDAELILARARGTYNNNQLPGTVEVWTKDDGIIKG